MIELKQYYIALFYSQIGFTGIRGREFSGDIGLDNIQITAGPCWADKLRKKKWVFLHKTFKANYICIYICTFTLISSPVTKLSKSELKYVIYKSFLIRCLMISARTQRIVSSPTEIPCLPLLCSLWSTPNTLDAENLTCEEVKGSRKYDKR